MALSADSRCLNVEKNVNVSLRLQHSVTDTCCFVCKGFPFFFFFLFIFFNKAVMFNNVILAVSGRE